MARMVTKAVCGRRGGAALMIVPALSRLEPAGYSITARKHDCPAPGEEKLGVVGAEAAPERVQSRPRRDGSLR